MRQTNPDQPVQVRARAALALRSALARTPADDTVTFTWAARHPRGADLDRVLEAMADLADLKSPNLAGHSRGVANLVDEAAQVSGL